MCKTIFWDGGVEVTSATSREVVIQLEGCVNAPVVQAVKVQCNQRAPFFQGILFELSAPCAVLQEGQRSSALERKEERRIRHVCRRHALRLGLHGFLQIPIHRIARHMTSFHIRKRIYCVTYGFVNAYMVRQQAVDHAFLGIHQVVHDTWILCSC